MGLGEMEERDELKRERKEGRKGEREIPHSGFSTDPSTDPSWDIQDPGSAIQASWEHLL